MKYFWLILFWPVILCAGVQVGTPIFAYYPLVRADAMLAIPRWKVGMNSTGSNLIVVPSHGSGENLAWVYSTDSGVSWDTVYSNHGLDGEGGTDDHLGTWFWNDTMYVGLPQDHAAPSDPLYRLIAAPWTSISDLGTLRELEQGGYNSIVMVVANDDSSWAITRSGGTDSIRHYISDDDFAADTTYQAINLLSLYHRIGTFMDYDTGTPMYAVFDTGTVGIFYRKWDGSNFDGLLDSSIAPGPHGGTSRAFTINYVNGLIHLLRSDGDGADSTFLIHHIQDATDTLGWDTPDTISRSGTVDQDLGYYPICTTYGDSLFVFYGTGTNGGTFAYKMWNGSSWDTDSTVVTGASNVENYVQTVPYVPSGVSYIPLVWTNVNDSLMFNKLTITSDSIRYVKVLQ